MYCQTLFVRVTYSPSIRESVAMTTHQQHAAPVGPAAAVAAVTSRFQSTRHRRLETHTAATATAAYCCNNGRM